MFSRLKQLAALVLGPINKADKALSPVEPSQKALSGTDQLHYRGKKVILRFAGDAAVIRWAFSAVGRSHV